MTRREFFAHRGFVTSSIGLYLRENPGDGSTLFAAPVQMVAMDSDPRVGSQEPFLGRYVDEFTFRLNDGNCGRHTLARLDSFVAASSGRRITYKQLIA